MKEIHIVPLNNILPHDLGVTCDCSPRLDYPSDETIIITHLAYDKRHLVEDLVEELAMELNYGNWGVFVEE